MSGILIFLHIPKTAGTSFNHILRDIYGKSFYRVKPGGKWRKAKRLPVSTRCVTGHMPYGIHKKWKLEDFQYVTLLRYPVDRIISLWWFKKEYSDSISSTGAEAEPCAILQVPGYF
jgi:hypothetical protein